MEDTGLIIQSYTIVIWRCLISIVACLYQEEFAYTERKEMPCDNKTNNYTCNKNDLYSRTIFM